MRDALARLLAATLTIPSLACAAASRRVDAYAAPATKHAATPVQDSGARSEAAASAPELAVAPLASAARTREGETWARVVENLKLYGDLRVRAESSFDLGQDPDRHRQVLRLRLGANYRVNDRTEVGARIVTGDPTNPNSPQVTLGNLFENFQVSLDRAFVLYRPERWAGSEVRAGKFNHPFYHNEVYGELLWDDDLQPEGLLARKTFEHLGLFDSLEATLGGYMLLEQAQSDDAGILAAELAATRRFASDWRSRFALAHYAYSDVTPGGSTAILDRNAGNATVDTNMDGQPDEFRSDFGIFDLNAGATYEGLAQPLIFSGEVIHNARAASDGDGWATGISLGRSVKQGDWQVYYQYQAIEQDAVFSAHAQDDFLLATNHRSHLVGASYQLADGVGLFLWGLFSSYDSPGPDDEGDPWRLRLDLNVKF